MNKLGYNIDMQCLMVFNVLFKVQNTHMAAERLGVSQSSVSRSLAKLREASGDQLFVREANHLVPTKHCLAIAKDIQFILSQLECVFNRGKDFSPDSLTGCFKIFAPPAIEDLYGGAISGMLASKTPNAKWIIEPWDGSDFEPIINSDVLMGLYYPKESIPCSITQKELTVFKNSFLTRPEHPLHTKRQLTLKDIKKYPFVRLMLAREGIATAGRYFGESLPLFGVDIAFKSSSVRSCANYLKHTDAIMLGSEEIALMYGLCTVKTEIIDDGGVQVGGVDKLNVFMSKGSKHHHLCSWLSEQLVIAREECLVGLRSPQYY